jgi:hypothetical protein
MRHDPRGSPRDARGSGRDLAGRDGLQPAGRTAEGGRFFADDDSHEAFLVALAAGNRRRVLALVAAIGASGLMLLAYDGDHLVIDGIKAVLLMVAGVVFLFVSYRHWPTRLFALPSERPAFRRQRCANCPLVDAGAIRLRD